MTESKPKKKSALLHKMQLPTEYGLFIAVNLLDLFITMLFIRFGGAEANPAAWWVLLSFGKTGFVAYKILLMLLVIALCEAVAQKRKPMAKLLIWFGIVAITFVAITSAVRFYNYMQSPERDRISSPLPRPRARVRRPAAEKWERVPLRSCKAEELGKKAAALDAAMTDAVQPLQTRERNKTWLHGENPRYDLINVAYFVGQVEGKRLVVASGSFLERGVPHVNQTDALVSMASLDGRRTVVRIDERTTRLIPPDAAMVWRFGSTRYARLLLKKCSDPHHFTIGTAVSVCDYDLRTGLCTGDSALSTSEHDSREPLQLVIDTSSAQMVITATHPYDGQDPQAEICAGSDNPDVKVEQLRRTSVRLTLPNPSS